MEVDVTYTPRMSIDRIIEIVYDHIYLFKVRQGDIYLVTVMEKESQIVKEEYSYSEVPNEVVDKLQELLENFDF